MRILSLKGTVCGGRGVKAGETVEASSADARTLILMGKAIEVSAPAEPLPDGDDGRMTQSVGLTSESGAAVVKKSRGKRR